MATLTEIGALRRAVDVPVDDPVYTETLLGDYYDSMGLNHSALQIWREKAAAYAKIVTTAEGGASRSMSDLHRAALEMVKMYEGIVAGESDPPAGDLDGMAYVVGVERV
jgi:hypothetical protein